MVFFKTISNDYIDNPYFVPRKEKMTPPNHGTKKGTHGDKRAKMSGFTYFDGTVAPRKDPTLAKLMVPEDLRIGTKVLQNLSFVMSQHTKYINEEFGNVICTCRRASNISRGHQAALLLNGKDIRNLRTRVWL